MRAHILQFVRTRDAGFNDRFLRKKLSDVGDSS
jgi:hypothetical protein